MESVTIGLRVLTLLKERSISIYSEAVDVMAWSNGIKRS